MADLFESWSPYIFAFNNPLRFIDPDGRAAKDTVINIPEVVVVGKAPNNTLNSFQTALDILGFIPIVGEVADAANGIIYAFHGQWGNSALSLIAIVPVIGDLGKFGRLGAKLLKLADKTKGVSGVYVITTKSGKKYIGQSKDVGKRLQQHMKSGKFVSDEIVDVKVTEVYGDKIHREVFEQKSINSATDGVPSRLSDKVINERDPIGPNRTDKMNVTVGTGKTYKME